MSLETKVPKIKPLKVEVRMSVGVLYVRVCVMLYRCMYMCTLVHRCVCAHVCVHRRGGSALPQILVSTSLISRLNAADTMLGMFLLGRDSSTRTICQLPLHWCFPTCSASLLKTPARMGKTPLREGWEMGDGGHEAGPPV